MMRHLIEHDASCNLRLLPREICKSIEGGAEGGLKLMRGEGGVIDAAALFIRSQFLATSQ